MRIPDDSPIATAFGVAIGALVLTAMAAIIGLLLVVIVRLTVWLWPW